jgi:dolichyl-diphosphooligosaccharide--protein glycosyltransferase
LEDFNRGVSDAEYQKQYFEALNDPTAASKKARSLEREENKKRIEDGVASSTTNDAPKDETQQPKGTVDEIYNTWEDTEDTTLMWTLISSNQVEELKQWMEEDPTVAFIRSRDGRGPMWWAFEQRNEDITKMLMKAGVPHTDRDSKGLTPVDLLEGNKE